jgi:hypothetical protein
MARSNMVGRRIERILAGARSRPVTRRSGAALVLTLLPCITAAAITNGPADTANAAADSDCARQIHASVDSGGKTAVAAQCWHVGPIALGMSRRDVEKTLGPADHSAKAQPLIAGEKPLTISYFLFPRDLAAELAQHPRAKFPGDKIRILAVTYTDDKVAGIDNNPARMVVGPRCQGDPKHADASSDPEMPDVPPDFRPFERFAGITTGDGLDVAEKTFGNAFTGNASHDFYNYAPVPITLGVDPDSLKIDGLSIASDANVPVGGIPRFDVTADSKSCLTNGFKLR